jgi:hypothetical protein
LTAAAQASGDVRTDIDMLLVRLLVLNALNYWAAEWSPVFHRDPVTVTETLTSVVFDGLRPRRESSGRRSAPSGRERRNGRDR